VEGAAVRLGLPAGNYHFHIQKVDDGVYVDGNGSVVSDRVNGRSRYSPPKQYRALLATLVDYDEPNEDPAVLAEKLHQIRA
jgi:hypothetical protein